MSDNKEFSIKNKLYVSGYVNNIGNLDTSLRKAVEDDVPYRLREVMEAYEALEYCDFVNELDDDHIDDFYDFIFEQPEFKDDVYTKNIYITEEDLDPYYEYGNFEGYDYACFIDIDLLPVYEKYAKARGIQSEFNHDKDKEEPEK